MAQDASLNSWINLLAERSQRWINVVPYQSYPAVFCVTKKCFIAAIWSATVRLGHWGLSFAHAPISN